MHCVCAHVLGGADVLVRVEVRRDLDHLVGGAGVQRARVVGRDDRDGAEAELACGAEDAQRDLPAVGHQHLLHALTLAVKRRPAGCALLEERTQALLPLGARAVRGDVLRRLLRREWGAG